MCVHWYCRFVIFICFLANFRKGFLKGLMETNKWLLFMLTTGLMVYFTVWLMFFHVSGDGLYYPLDKFHKSKFFTKKYS